MEMRGTTESVMIQLYSLQLMDTDGVLHVAALPHRVTEDDIHEGYFIPKGTTVFANIWSVSHSSLVHDVFTHTCATTLGLFSTTQRLTPAQIPLTRTDLLPRLGKQRMLLARTTRVSVTEDGKLHPY